MVEPASQARVDSAPRHVEQIGDLSGRVLEEIAEDDHGAVLRFERREAGGHALRERVSEVAGVELFLSLGFHGLTAQGARPGPVDRAVDDDAVQPRREGPAAVEPVEVAHGCEEGLLGDVLRGGAVVDDEKGSPVRPGPVLAEQSLEVRDRSRLCAANPGALLPAGAHHRALTIRASLARRSIRQVYER